MLHKEILNNSHLAFDQGCWSEVTTQINMPKYHFFRNVEQQETSYIFIVSFILQIIENSLNKWWWLFSVIDSRAAHVSYLLKKIDFFSSLYKIIIFCIKTILQEFNISKMQRAIMQNVFKIMRETTNNEKKNVFDVPY